ncbi:MAG: hypothetical protein K6E30_01925 [Lachnospiraceae bacterium]|nr:hypothetical protein [Lachnospiraceae bacterium]
MRNRIINILVLLAVFIAGVLFFGRFMNAQVTDSASDLLDSTLPVLCMEVDGCRTGLMYGYKEEMEEMRLRDALVPLTTDRELVLCVKPNGNTIRSVAFSVSAPDTGETIEARKISNFREDGDYQIARFSLEQPIRMNREYPIAFHVETGSGSVHYYTRLIMREELLTDRYLTFVDSFYRTCIDKSYGMELGNYLETDTQVNGTSLAEVDIHSTYSQVTFGNLAPVLVREAVPTIREISPAACTIINEYLISAEIDDQEHYYNVSEYYRLRYGNNRVMLLNFERKMNEVFDGKAGSVTAEGICLGASEREVEYLVSDDGNITVFIADGELWSYNENEGTLSEIFGFHQLGSIPDEREDHRDYEIRIQRVSNEGVVDFSVVGYMNRGKNEGLCGVSIMQYVPDGRFVEERFFIGSRVGFAELKEDTDELLYIAEDGRAFVYINGTVLKADPKTENLETILSGIDPNCFAASQENAMIAWSDSSDRYAIDKLTIMYLENGSTREITAESGRFLRAVGFINEDFIYGIADAADIYTYPAGGKLFAMKELRIETFGGEAVKTYAPEGMWIIGTELKEGLVEIFRAVKENGLYAAAPNDNIMNNRKSANSQVSVSLSSDIRTGTLVTLALPSGKRSLSPLVGSFRMRSVDGGIHFSPQYVLMEEKPCYYAYGKGKLLAILPDVSEAVRLADENYGTVMDREGRYIYERANLKTKVELANEDIPEAFFSGKIAADELAAGLPEGFKVLDLSGCTLDQVLYELSCGRAVRALLPGGTDALIVGYDAYNTLLYNYADGSHYYMGLNDSRAAFSAGGNVFVSYIEPHETIKR